MEIVIRQTETIERLMWRNGNRKQREKKINEGNDKEEEQKDI